MPGFREIQVPVRVGPRELQLAAWNRDTGSEHLLLFVHGLGCSKRSFQGAWAEPRLRAFSLLAVDLPGFGRSPRPEGYSYELDEQAGVLTALIDAHATRRIHVVAHSMGGSLALLVPPRTLARLDNLVLVEPRLLKESCGVAAEASRHEFDEFQREFMPQFRQRCMADPRVTFDVDLADPVAFHAAARSLLHWAGTGELLDRFLHAPCPVWFWYGQDNRHLAELSHLPAAQTQSFSDAAHFPMQDNPSAFYGHLAALVGAAPRR
ncbi:MAG TPA: alpha/beta hydrolase [Chromatiales bacterium]|nr:alpha/beta hydrolase [Chromatiales bacterium]